MQKTIRFTKDRETKGAVRYAECDAKGKALSRSDNPVVGNLYIRKDALGDSVPNAVSVTLKAA